jgi:excisionase family DNA binding protein
MALQPVNRILQLFLSGVILPDRKLTRIAMYLTVTDAAKRLKVSRQWTTTLINQGKIATTILAGRRVVIADKAFQAMEKGRRTRKVKA